MKFLLVNALTMFSIYASCGGSCILKLNEHLPIRKEPVFLTNDLKFLFPKRTQNGVAIELQYNECILIACPGKSNAVYRTGYPVSSAVCLSGTWFVVDYRTLMSQSFGCRRRPQTSLKITGTQCAKRKGVTIELGYQISGRWLPLLEVCHNISAGETYYSQHLLRGSLIPGKEKGCPRPGFSLGNSSLYPGYYPYFAYSWRNQKLVLSRLVGETRAEEMLNQTTLSHGHLSPDADFLFATHQALTYFYVNVAPQWQSINQNNWLLVENSVRKLAKNLGDDLVVVTGTYGVLKIQGHELRLLESSLPVPEFLWKVVRNARDDSCIVLVVTNDPFSAAPRPLDPCSADCPRYHWPRFENHPKKGVVHCCQYRELRKAIPYLPALSCKKPLWFQ